MSDDTPTSSVNPQDELSRISEIAKDEGGTNTPGINTSVQPAINSESVDQPPAVQPPIQQETKTENTSTPPNLTMGDSNKSSKTLIIIAVVFFVLSLAGIGFYYLGLKKVSKETTEIPTPIPTMISTPTATADPTENWKTFTSPEKFSLKYPLDAKVQENGSIVSLGIWGPTQKEGTEFYDGISLSFKIGNLSKGYQQRVGIAQAIIHSPEIIILDEPTVGLDPVAVLEIRELIKSLTVDHTILFSSHQLHEVELLCSDITLINEGRVLVSGVLSEIQKKFSTQKSYKAVVGKFNEELNAKEIFEILKYFKSLSNWAEKFGKTI